MIISMIGTGYVGLVSGTCFSEMGNTVWCIDIDEKKIDNLKKGVIPIYEPGLEEMVLRNSEQGRLLFTTDYAEAVPSSDICFIAVGTPPGEDGSADISYVLQAAKNIAAHMTGYTVIVDKSTVPVGTSELVTKAVREVLKERGADIPFDVVSNPEFLKEGVAIEDFMRPDRVVIGCDSERAGKVMKELYSPFISNNNPLIVMDIKSAEITKYAANAMLATRISFMNEIAMLCEKVGGDVKAVRQGIGTDSRIGMSFLYAGCGYGGSCFPKDVKELVSVGQRNGLDMKIASAVEEVNERQKHHVSAQVFSHFGTDLSGRTFAVWGLSFKPQTDDMREAPSLEVIRDLVRHGAAVSAYDPEAFEQTKHYLSDIPAGRIRYANSMTEALENADALILMTEWKMFRQPDFNLIKSKLKSPVIFDGRNQYEPGKMREMGFTHYCIGRNI